MLNIVYMYNTCPVFFLSKILGTSCYNGLVKSVKTDKQKKQMDFTKKINVIFASVAVIPTFHVTQLDFPWVSSILSHL